MSSNIIPGEMILEGSIPDAQLVTALIIIADLPSGTDQADAGAAANEFWITSGHATLPDNVVMRGT